MTSFRNISVNWENVTALTQARNIQAQDNLQQAASKGLRAGNFGPQSQESVQEDQSHATADATIKIPRSEDAYEGDTGPEGPDVVVLGHMLHADNDNINQQSQKLLQDAIMGVGPIPDDSGGSSYNPSADRAGATNVGGQIQSNVQEKKAIAKTHTRLIEVGGLDPRRAGTVVDLKDIRAKTYAENLQVQELNSTAIVEDQGAFNIVPLGASNISGQESDSWKDLVSHTEVGFTAPTDDPEVGATIGTGTFLGTFEDITADTLALNDQTSIGNQVAIDANVSGGNGEAMSVMPQRQRSAQIVDTRSTLDVRPRAFTSRDNSVSARNINANSISDSSQFQGGSQLSQVESFGQATNEMSAAQVNRQEGVTVASVNLVF